MASTPERFPKDILFQMWKEEKLEEAPLLGSYLNKESNDKEWIEEVEESTRMHKENFDSFFGDEWSRTHILTLTMFAQRENIFTATSPEFNKDAHITLISSQLLFMGYEIGTDQEMLESFSKDITEKISTFHINNPKAKRQDLATFVTLGLYTGANLRDLVDNRMPPEEKCEKIAVDDVRLTPFRSFINGLEF